MTTTRSRGAVEGSGEIDDATAHGPTVPASRSERLIRGRREVLKGLCVLAIDDDPDVLRLIEIKLRRAGLHVRTALTGDQGLAIALAHRPDVLISEVMLPERDGRSIVAEVKRQLGAAAPVAILMSEHGREADIVGALAGGADDYVVTPFSPRELLVRITVALARAGRLVASVSPVISSSEIEG